MFAKLVLCRVKYCSPHLLDSFAAFVDGEPLPVLPQAWGDEDGLSHYGFTLKGMGLKDVERLREFAAKSQNGAVTVHDLGDSKKTRSAEEALASVGLRIHPAP